MAKNINCAAMGYECVYSLTAGDDEQQLMFDTTERHAAAKHPELMNGQEFKPEIKQKLKSLLEQSHYTTG
jgi:predicted small metal-binding protein